MLPQVAEQGNEVIIKFGSITDVELSPTYLPAEQQPALVYLASLSIRSRNVQGNALLQIASMLTAGRCDYRSLPWWLIRWQHTTAVRSTLMERYAPASGNRMLCALKGTIKSCWRLGMMDRDTYERTVDWKSITGETLPQAAGRMLTFGEFQALMAVCSADDSAAGARDAAIIGVGYVGGLRREEIVQLRMVDYDRQGQTLFVVGKRRKQRSVPITDPGAVGALDDWLNVRGLGPGPLFLRIRRGGHIQYDALSGQAIYDMLYRRAKEAGINQPKPHDLRRTFASDQLDAGTDISVVQKIMGHANANTTAGYDRRGERAKKEAAGRLHLPYQRKYV